MSEHYRRRRTADRCGGNGKVRYATCGAAVRARLACMERRPAEPLRVYGPCWFCGGWHLTKQAARYDAPTRDEEE